MVFATKWTAIVPFYNEEEYLGRTLASLASQSVGDIRFVLVDNASSDRSGQIAREFAARQPAGFATVIDEPRPGKINALEAGIGAAETDYVTLCDADTIYPPKYLETAASMLARENVVAALGFGIYDHWPIWRQKFARRKGAVAAALMPHQCHTGGYGQSFRREALVEAGGYSHNNWGYMVADHEVMHRVAKLGVLAYSSDLWCITSSRRTDRKRVDWTTFEQIVYHLTPFHRKDWFFYDFLKSRFDARGFTNLNLRARDWDKPGKNP